MRLRLHGLSIDWLTRISDWQPGVRFADEQIAGPYRDACASRLGR